MKDLALLLLRLTTGGLLAGHGTQKLFGCFGGYGLEGTGGFMESLGLRPGTKWAALAGLSELGGGALTAVGFLNPVGPISTLAAMSMAAIKAHGGKPIWATEGGAELPVTNMAIALTLAVLGPGRYSLDRAFGVRLPTSAVLLVFAATAAGVLQGLNTEMPEPQQEAVQDKAGTGTEADVSAGVA